VTPHHDHRRIDFNLRDDYSESLPSYSVFDPDLKGGSTSKPLTTEMSDDPKLISDGLNYTRITKYVCTKYVCIMKVICS
jgi:hypothetical protein